MTNPKSQLTKEQQKLIDESSEIQYPVAHQKEKTVRAFYGGGTISFVFNRIWGLNHTQRFIDLGDISSIFGGIGNIIYVNILDNGGTLMQGNVADEEKDLLAALKAIADNEYIAKTTKWIPEHAAHVLETFDGNIYTEQNGFKWVYEDGNLYIDHPTMTGDSGRTRIDHIQTFYEMSPGKTMIDIAFDEEDDAEIFGVAYDLPIETIMEIFEDISKRFVPENKDRILTLKRIKTIIQNKKEETKDKEKLKKAIDENESGMWIIEPDGTAKPVGTVESFNVEYSINKDGLEVLVEESILAKFANQTYDKELKGTFLDGQIALNTYKWIENRLYVKIHTKDTIAIIDVLSMDHLWYDGEQVWLYAIVDPYKGGTVLTRHKLNEPVEIFLERLVGAKEELENCDSPLHDEIMNRISHVIDSFATIHEAHSRFTEEFTIIDDWEIPETSFDHISVAEEESDDNGKSTHK